jgi:hypothetical protein
VGKCNKEGVSIIIVYYEIVEHTKSYVSRVHTNTKLRERALEKMEAQATDSRQFRDHSRVVGRDVDDRLFAAQRN